MRVILSLAAFMLLTGCSQTYQLDLKYDAASGSLTVAAFERGLFWGRMAVAICPERIIAEELTQAGPVEDWSHEVEDCAPHHRWSFIPRRANGAPLYHATVPKAPIAVSITGNGWHAGTGWVKL